MGLAFQKYEGLGNDFLVVEAPVEGSVPASRAAALCDRHFGVGADGVLLVLPSRDPSCDVRMRVVNADGSVPEMCGNGVRCVALHVARARGARSLTLRVDTDAGPRVCVVDDRDGGATVTVDMGTVRVLGDRSLDVEGRGPVEVTLADAGNPHAVLFGAFGRGDVESLGPRIATHAAFPAGTNAEFAAVKGGEIDLVVWERGVGITLACGTGACATVAAACARGLVARGTPVPVRLPGGRLDITIAEDGRCTMKGPARLVFTGVAADAV
jgi:diaminopimelate epimerase